MREAVKSVMDKQYIDTNKKLTVTIGPLTRRDYERIMRRINRICSEYNVACEEQKS